MQKVRCAVDRVNDEDNSTLLANFRGEFLSHGSRSRSVPGYNRCDSTLGFAVHGCDEIGGVLLRPFQGGDVR